MTLYVKVTRGYKWPFLSLVVYMLDRWFFFVSCILWVKECKEITTNSVTLTRDLVRQGHAWLQVTFPISGSIYYARSMIFFCFLHFMGQGMQRNNNQLRKIIDLACILPEIGKVTCNHAWPWRTRSRVKVTHLVVISLHSLTHRMQETKKIHRSSMYTTRDRKGHL